MTSFRRGLIAGMLPGLVACAAQRPAPRVDPAPPGPVAAPAASPLDDLLLFAGTLAEASPAERLAQCRELRRRHRSDPSLDTSLRLLLAQSASERCGELPASTALIKGSLPAITDARLKSFLTYHQALLVRLDREEDRRKSLEKRVTLNRSRVEKAARRLQSQEGELKTLQKKLEALKAIEQSLDEPNDGH